jgi:hypothetical protein
MTHMHIHSLPCSPGFSIDGVFTGSPKQLGHNQRACTYTQLSCAHLSYLQADPRLTDPRRAKLHSLAKVSDMQSGMRNYLGGSVACLRYGLPSAASCACTLCLYVQQPSAKHT